MQHSINLGIPFFHQTANILVPLDIQLTILFSQKFQKYKYKPNQIN